MDEHVEIPDLPGYCTIKEAAKSLGGISEQRVYDLINAGRLRAIRLGRGIGVLQEDVDNFQPKMTGRPRKGPPVWRVPPADNRMEITRMFVQVKPGQEKALMKVLDGIRQRGEHLLSGTIARYIAESQTVAGQIEIELIWRGVNRQEEDQKQQELEAFKQALADVLDWSTVEYSSSKVLLHTSGQ